jgi:hypothetical protein
MATDSADHASVAASLAQLTSGWTPVAGLPPGSLAAAREALASSIVAGKTVADLHTRRVAIAGTPADPKLFDDLTKIAAKVRTATVQPATIAVVRSPFAASLNNPTGAASWAFHAQVTNTLGPFQDSIGLLHWVDFIRITVSSPIAFGSAASPFGVVPVSQFVISSPSPTKLTLGAGSVWFIAKWLAATLPDGFTGFSIAGGTLTSSTPFQLQNGTYVAPVNATLTLAVTLAAAASPSGTSPPGSDGAAATFTPPATVTLVFKQSSAVFQSIADCSAKAFGTAVTLRRNQESPTAAPQWPLIVIPCQPAPTDFPFADTASDLFTPSAVAKIAHAGWALPLVNTAVTSLPEIAGPGTCLLQLAGDAALKTALYKKPVPVTTWFLNIGSGSVFALAIGKAKPADTHCDLWPENAPSKFKSSVDFTTKPNFSCAFLSWPGHETFLVDGTVKVHLDRPVTATGARFPYRSDALYILDRTKSADALGIIAERKDQTKPVYPVALENALIGVDAPAFFTLAATIKNDALSNVIAAFYHNARWLLPTLPDPYATSFDLSIVKAEAELSTVGALVAAITWTGSSKPELGFVLLPPPSGNIQSDLTAGAHLTNSFADAPPMVHAPVAMTRGQQPSLLALLDLSTRVDLFGVALAPDFGRLIGIREGIDPSDSSTKSVAPFMALQGMTLALNGAAVATFALPQVSWEPMESNAPDSAGPMFRSPPGDGYPLLAAAPDAQKLVPFMPNTVLANNIGNVANGAPFWALFSLPFGINAIILQPNEHLSHPRKGHHSTFRAQGGEFRLNRPRFDRLDNAPEDGGGTPAETSRATAPEPSFVGALALTLKPKHPEKTDANFPGYSSLDNPYGVDMLGPGPNSPSDFFTQHFSSGSKAGVPLRRIDFSGYGASIFSEWSLKDVIPPDIIKVQFETTIGRTAYEVVQAANLIYPYCVRSVRTITIERRNAGWVKRTDSGWIAVSPGRFEFPSDTSAKWAGRIHSGAMAGVFNVRNIREMPEVVPSDAVSPFGTFAFRRVLFDADIGIEPSLKVTAGGFSTPVDGVTNPPTLVAARDLEGYMQTTPIEHSPEPDVLRGLFKNIGAVHPAINCTIEAGAFGGKPGTTLRCAGFDVDVIGEPVGNPKVPAIAVALRAAPHTPAGGWSLGHRKFNEPAPSALPKDSPVPFVRPDGNTSFWYMADVSDVLQLDNPDNFYSLMHSTGTNKVLFESPQIPTSAAVTPAPTRPGLQFVKPTPPGAPKPGAAPTNPGSPNFGDIASLLNSTGLFPDLGAALSLAQSAADQLSTTGQGIKYQKDYTFDPNQQVVIADIGVVKIVLQYADTVPLVPGSAPAKLSYSVDSSASPNWTLSVGPLSFLVTLPAFGSNPLLTIRGSFYADEHTAPGVTGLSVQFGDTLSVIKNIFSSLQAVAQFLPGGAGANLDVGLSDGKLTVSDTFTIGDMPLGVGNLTDVSVKIGLRVALQPLSIDFSVGLGDARNPFNWIVSPLAGNGLIVLGVEDSKPALTIQAGIGLGLAIDLGIASGSASVVIAFQIHAEPPAVMLMAILTGRASVDVLDGLVSATLTISAGLGFEMDLPPKIVITPFPPSITLGPETITLIATCSVGIHLSVCWVVSVDWDGSWEFQQSVTTPQISLSV